MIVRMQKLTVLALAGERDAALTALQDLGVVHVVHVRAPLGTGLELLEAARSRLQTAQAALTVLENTPAAVDVGPGSPPVNAASPASADDTIAEVDLLRAEREDKQESLLLARREVERYSPYGDFDPSIGRRLMAEGVDVTLASAGKEEAPPDIEGAVVRTLARDEEKQYICIVMPPGGGSAKTRLGAEWTTVPWPTDSLSVMRATVESVEGRRASIDDRLRHLKSHVDVVAGRVQELSAAAGFAAVRAGMGESGVVVYLEGYVPSDDRDRVRQAAEQNGWGILFADPQPGDDVPTCLRYSRWVRPVRTVLDFLRVYPGYWESDVGPVFLIFFSLFFAMLVGDAGYGALLLVVTAVLQRRMKKVPAHVFHMMYIVSGATLVWGVLNGQYFGIPNLPPFLESLEIPWLADRDNLIRLCFIIAAVHLSVAHVWNIVVLTRARRWTKAFAQVGWLMVVWGMFLLASQTVLGIAMPGFALYMLIAGFVLVALFMATREEFKANWIGHALLPLTMVSNFVDILSYIRLFAVGYASVAVLAAFNDMASSIGFDNPFTAVAASLLLLFANALNLILCALGVLVHAVRLNTLEFSTHKGLQWAGYNLYTPFASNREPFTDG